MVDRALDEVQRGMETPHRRDPQRMLVLKPYFKSIVLIYFVACDITKYLIVLYLV